jgi:hypothetical protein
VRGRARSASVFGPVERPRCILPEQQFRILEILLRSNGELVSREEIRKRLWPNDTVVEFDSSINSTIKKLRAALGDSADHPRFIETVARRGYRFMIKVDFPDAAPLAPAREKAVDGPLLARRYRTSACCRSWTAEKLLVYEHPGPSPFCSVAGYCSTFGEDWSESKRRSQGAQLGICQKIGPHAGIGPRVIPSCA